MTPDELMFFDGHLAALPLYERFRERLLTLYPATAIRVQKTQITLSNRHVYVCASFLRVKKKAELPDPYLVITLGLPYPLTSPRVAAKVEPYPGRWTTHIVLGTEAELDDELFTWVQQAYDFAENK